MAGGVDIPIIHRRLPVTAPNGVRCKDHPLPARFPRDPVLLGSTAMHHSVRSPVTHRAARAHTTRVHPHSTDYSCKRGHAGWSINAHTDTWRKGVRAHTTQRWKDGVEQIYGPKLNDVSNLTLLDKILRDARRGLPGHALTVTPPLLVRA